jgi:hypothetical protein
MPAVDAYDDGIPRPERPPDDTEIPVGPWYHATDYDLPDGTVLAPGGGKSNYEHVYQNPKRQNRADWVWLSRTPVDAQIWGKNVYEVQPDVEGPWPWNGDPYQYVAPQAKIVRRLGPDEVPTSFARSAAQSLIVGPDDAYDEWQYFERQAEPQHDAPEGVDWYHVSPHELPVGTTLAPLRGETPWTDDPYKGGLDNRANWIWVEHDPNKAREWMRYILQHQPQCHLYRVVPRLGPFAWNGSAVEGWVTDSAVIKEYMTATQRTAAQVTEELGYNDANYPPLDPPAPVVHDDALPAIDIEAAKAVTNSKGQAYGEIDTATLAHMANAIRKVQREGRATDEHLYKLSAIQAILSSKAILSTR